eukprot:gnl/Chilomastix_caulleri/1637.p2 GENE.gnl/Chilomastix_caulleri/1637~~gnl/Chilomastix_caulleri/1637.p2  ORF type:complete len:85 (+),score=21.13 gnl/Chilomastix_caulleri/1637:972-1226(+)
MIVMTYSCREFPMSISDGSSSPGRWADGFVDNKRLGFVPVVIAQGEETSYERLKDSEISQVVGQMFKGCVGEVTQYPFPKDDGK